MATKQAVLERYSAGPDLLRSVIHDLADEQLDLRLSPDSWSIRQLVHHVTDGDYLWKEFILQAAGDPGREFNLAWYWCLPQDDWVKRWSYAGRDVTHSLTLFEANRRHSVELLQQLPWLWNQSLLITTLKAQQERVAVAEVVEMQSRHVEGHVQDIHNIRQAHGI